MVSFLEDSDLGIGQLLLGSDQSADAWRVSRERQVGGEVEVGRGDRPERPAPMIMMSRFSVHSMSVVDRIFVAASQECSKHGGVVTELYSHLIGSRR
jgi:hypothetical protein